MMDPFLLIAGSTILASGLIAALVGVAVRGRSPAPAVRQDLEVKLAVAEERASRVAALERAVAEKVREIEGLRVEKAKLEESQAYAEERMAALRKEFALATSEARETLGATNREQVTGLLSPLREQLRVFEASLEQSNQSGAAERLQLREQMRELALHTASWRNEADALKRALSSDTRVQGAWGEMVLESILAKSGLRAGEEYVVQETQQARDEGQRLRPDVIVRLPNGERIVIDAKVSLTAFYDYVASGNREALEGLKASLRGHVRNLASKEYAQASGSGLDFVILFVPVEGAFAAAVSQEADPELVEFALSQGVTIATPTTLVLALRTVYGLWQVERRNAHAEEIAARAGRLYDRLAGFVEDMKKLDDRLRQARESYQSAWTKLAGGRANMLEQAEGLRELGARTTKVMDSGKIHPDPPPQEPQA